MKYTLVNSIVVLDDEKNAVVLAEGSIISMVAGSAWSVPPPSLDDIQAALTKSNT